MIVDIVNNCHKLEFVHTRSLMYALVINKKAYFYACWTG